MVHHAQIFSYYAFEKDASISAYYANESIIVHVLHHPLLHVLWKETTLGILFSRETNILGCVSLMPRRLLARLRTE